MSEYGMARALAAAVGTDESIDKSMALYDQISAEVFNRAVSA
ncbi:hypothetical protein [Plantibacter sp. M259]|nr:hypothetical protein [Plantibacter sp. M259]